MDISKKHILSVFILFSLISSLSGCIFEDIFSGTEFNLQSYEIVDYQGFPALNLFFSCDGTVTLKTIDTSSKIIDTDYFFSGDHQTYMMLGEYYSTLDPGTYNMRVYDKNLNNIYSKSIEVQGSDLLILDCEQNWWEKENFGNKYHLFGLEIEVKNVGDVPCYPHTIDVYLDSNFISDNILPTVILSGKSKSIFSPIYQDTHAQKGDISLNVKDIDNEILAINSFPVDFSKRADVNEFKWSYRGLNVVQIPYNEYLYNYYIGLERINIEDYSLYVFNTFDEEYIDIINSALLSSFEDGTDVEKINFAASFVQHFEYMEDTTELDYPRYPIETLFNNGGGGDCEDKAILTASILKNMGFNVSLFRLPDHMAVGVNISSEELSEFDFYLDGYYFLETTTGRNPCGFIPKEYKDLASEAVVYPIVSRPLLDHVWEDEIITIYKNTEDGDLVKVSVFVENYGNSKAEDITLEAGFFTLSDQKIASRQTIISSIEPGMKEKAILSVNIPKGVTTSFKTRILIDGEIIDERESVDTFG